jgi:hypothetical protein
MNATKMKAKWLNNELSDVNSDIEKTAKELREFAEFYEKDVLLISNFQGAVKATTLLQELHIRRDKILVQIELLNDIAESL